MADGDSELFKDFEEFLKAREAKKKEESDSEDFDVEIWDEKGRGVRTRRSHALPFLNQLGLDLPAEPDKTKDNDGDDKSKSRSNSSSNKPSNTPAPGVAKRYFSPKKPS